MWTDSPTGDGYYWITEWPPRIPDMNPCLARVAMTEYQSIGSGKWPISSKHRFFKIDSPPEYFEPFRLTDDHFKIAKECVNGVEMLEFALECQANELEMAAWGRAQRGEPL